MGKDDPLLTMEAPSDYTDQGRVPTGQLQLKYATYAFKLNR